MRRGVSSRITSRSASFQIPISSAYGRVRTIWSRSMLSRCHRPEMMLYRSLNRSTAAASSKKMNLKSALGKKRIDGKQAPLQPLTTIQRVHISRLVEKYGDDYKSMFMDIKLNKMQHSVATLEKLCKRYHMYKDKNPLLVGPWKKK
ncbi:hypothetical protein CASFOL_008992 [Castilleja foliolosa]|uniref:Nucleolar protein 16 n=1 Tax=Castilleja foliolosa TaxID=1961234 RepID=A0ABD3E4M8_9LAMI